MYCLRLVIVVLQELHCLLQCLLVYSLWIPSFVLIGCCVRELRGHLCPYRNVWFEGVYCCFTRTVLFTDTVNTRLVAHAQLEKHVSKSKCRRGSIEAILRSLSSL